MAAIIEVTCKYCEKKQKMEIRKVLPSGLKNKRKKCVWCEKSFKIN